MLFSTVGGARVTSAALSYVQCCILVDSWPPRWRPHKGELNDQVTGEIQMSSSDDWKKTVRLNKLLGLWAAEKLGISGRDAETYSDALAVDTLDPERSDVLGKIRKDFDAAGVVQSDEQILRVMNELTLQAGSQISVGRGGAADALTVMLARKLKPET
jgi:hypothetical protein